MRLTLTVDAQRFARGMLAERLRIARGMRDGASDAQRDVLGRIRQQTASSGMRGAQNLANAWTDKGPNGQKLLYPPPGKDSLSPAFMVVSKAPAIHSWMNRREPITAKNGRYLLIPTSINQVTAGQMRRARGASARAARDSGSDFRAAVSSVRVTPEQMGPGSGAFFIRRKTGPGWLWCLPVSGFGGRRGNSKRSLNVGGMRLMTGHGAGQNAKRYAMVERGFVALYILTPVARTRKVLDIEGMRSQLRGILLQHVTTRLAAARGAARSADGR